LDVAFVEGGAETRSVLAQLPPSAGEIADDFVRTPTYARLVEDPLAERHRLRVALYLKSTDSRGARDAPPGAIRAANPTKLQPRSHTKQSGAASSKTHFTQTTYTRRSLQIQEKTYEFLSSFWQLHKKGRPLARSAYHTNRPAVRIDDVF